MNQVRRGYCEGCPYDHGKGATEMAYNLGCLPGALEIAEHIGDGAWPCHAEPDKVCCGFVAQRPDRIGAELRPMEGVHASARTGEDVDVGE